MNKIKYVIGVILLLCLTFSAFAGGQAETDKAESVQKLDKIVLSSPFSPLAMPMAYIIENDLLKDYAEKTELAIWTNPDQLRAQMSGGSADFVSLPSNTASIFYNKGVKLKLLKVSIWKVFYIVSEDTSVSSIEDLRGKTIYVPFRGDQPDLVFQTIFTKAGIDPSRDITIQYVQSPQDIVMNLMGDKAEYGMMIEPVATVAQIKGAQKGKKIARVIDVQKEWGRLLNLEERLPNAGVAAMPGILEHPEVVDAFAKIYDEAVKWSVENPKEAGLLAAKYVEGVPAPAFTKAMEFTTFESISSGEVKDEIETMFSEFMHLNPASVGGKLPDENFYY